MSLSALTLKVDRPDYSRYEPGRDVVSAIFTPTSGAEAEVVTVTLNRATVTTPDESSQCYRQYRLDVRLRFWEESDTQRKCKECQGWTTGRAECGWEVIPLCPSHQTLEIAARHM